MEDVMSRRYQRQAEKHKRTVFAANVHPKVEEYEVFEFFSEAGKVVDIQLLRDPRSFRSKGLCYIEFDDSKDVPIALSLSGRQLGGFPIVVQLTQAEKNIAAQIAQDMANSQRSIKVKVKNLAKEMREEDLHPVFAAFGDVTEIYLRRASDGQTREGFVEFVKSSEGVAAMQQLNGLEILGLKMQVYTDKPIDYTGMLDPTALAQNIAGGASVPEIADGPSLAEDSGNGGLLLSNSARMGLMAKLSKGAFPDMPQPGQPVPGIAAPQATVTPCLLLKNMFNPSAEADPDFDLDIREDVMDEVQKYGTLRHIYVDKTSSDGRVYLKFAGNGGSIKTLQALHNRWFGQNQIQASHLPPDQYAAQFPDAA